MEQVQELAIEPDFQTDEELLVNEWRVEQLLRLGVTKVIAEMFAGVIDWHEIAKLVECGCAPELAIEIVR
jgi:hypothetical protein